MDELMGDGEKVVVGWVVAFVRIVAKVVWVAKVVCPMVVRFKGDVTTMDCPSEKTTQHTRINETT